MKMRLAVALFVSVTCVTQVCGLNAADMKPLWGKVHSVRGGAPPSSRLANSSPASIGQFPHQALIVLDKASFCGGSLISENWVLTSGYCTDKKSSFRVSLGILDISTRDEGGKTVMSRDAITHESFNPYTYNDDIGLIHIPPVTDFNSFMKPVKLPTFSDASNTYLKTQAEVSGWGNVCEGDGSVKDLRYIVTTVISNEECTYVFPKYSVPASKMCTFEGESSGFMAHDSGDPLVIVDQGIYVQIGVASFSSSNLCQSAVPSAHTRLTAYLSWLHNKTGLVKPA